MPSSRDEDREIARRAADRQAREKDYRMTDLPGYIQWSERKLDEGEPEVLIAHLGATSAWLLPEEAAAMTEADFEELLASLKMDLGEGD